MRVRRQFLATTHTPAALAARQAGATETLEPAVMPIDESLPSSRPPTSGASAPTGIKPPVLAKGSTTPGGGVPPMFLSPVAPPLVPRGDALEH